MSFAAAYSPGYDTAQADPAPTPTGTWPYATPEQLAEALRIRVSPTNQQLLDDCLAAAATEIDADLDRVDPLPDPVPALVSRVNVNRAVEWYKAADAAYGIVGFEQVGLLHAPKDGFARHAVNLTPLKQQWGIA